MEPDYQDNILAQLANKPELDSLDLQKQFGLEHEALYS